MVGFLTSDTTISSPDRLCGDVLMHLLDAEHMCCIWLGACVCLYACEITIGQIGAGDILRSLRIVNFGEICRLSEIHRQVRECVPFVGGIISCVNSQLGVGQLEHIMLTDTFSICP